MSKQPIHKQVYSDGLKKILACW